MTTQEFSSRIIKQLRELIQRPRKNWYSIMRRVGGGVMFIHRHVLEYFADEWERQYGDEFME